MRKRRNGSSIWIFSHHDWTTAIHTLQKPDRNRQIYIIINDKPHTDQSNIEIWMVMIGYANYNAVLPSSSIDTFHIPRPHNRSYMITPNQTQLGVAFRNPSTKVRPGDCWHVVSSTLHWPVRCKQKFADQTWKNFHAWKNLHRSMAMRMPRQKAKWTIEVTTSYEDAKKLNLPYGYETRHVSKG